MNPALKKICRQRACGYNPSNWQGNGGKGDKCPNCESSLFTEPTPIGKATRFRCYNCNTLFERKGWTGFKVISINDNKAMEGKE